MESSESSKREFSKAPKLKRKTVVAAIAIGFVAALAMVYRGYLAREIGLGNPEPVELIDLHRFFMSAPSRTVGALVLCLLIPLDVRACFVSLASLMSVYMTMIVCDGVVDGSSHNLLPFELAFVTVVMLIIHMPALMVKFAFATIRAARA